MNIRLNISYVFLVFLLFYSISFCFFPVRFFLQHFLSYFKFLAAVAVVHSFRSFRFLFVLLIMHTVFLLKYLLLLFLGVFFSLLLNCSLFIFVCFSFCRHSNIASTKPSPFHHHQRATTTTKYVCRSAKHFLFFSRCLFALSSSRPRPTNLPLSSTHLLSFSLSFRISSTSQV